MTFIMFGLTNTSDLSMFTVYMTNAFQSSITGNLTSYILSEYQSHSLIAVIYIVSNVMSAATYLPVAKICNVFGRAQAFTAMASFATFGLILTAATNSVEMYAAAQVCKLCCIKGPRTGTLTTFRSSTRLAFQA